MTERINSKVGYSTHSNYIQFFNYQHVHDCDSDIQQNAPSNINFQELQSRSGTNDQLQQYPTGLPTECFTHSQQKALTRRPSGKSWISGIFKSQDSAATQNGTQCKYLVPLCLLLLKSAPNLLCLFWNALSALIQTVQFIFDYFFISHFVLILITSKCVLQSRVTCFISGMW